MFEKALDVLMKEVERYRADEANVIDLRYDVVKLYDEKPLTRSDLEAVAERMAAHCDFKGELIPTAAKSVVTRYLASRTPSDTEGKYYELIYAVGRKHDGESRHETALRYIRQREQGFGASGAATKSVRQDTPGAIAAEEARKASPHRFGSAQ